MQTCGGGRRPLRRRSGPPEARARPHPGCPSRPSRPGCPTASGGAQGQGREFILFNDRTTVGSSPNADIVIDTSSENNLGSGTSRQIGSPEGEC